MDTPTSEFPWYAGNQETKPQPRYPADPPGTGGQGAPPPPGSGSPYGQPYGQPQVQQPYGQHPWGPPSGQPPYADPAGSGPAAPEPPRRGGLALVAVAAVAALLAGTVGAVAGVRYESGRRPTALPATAGSLGASEKSSSPAAPARSDTAVAAAVLPSVVSIEGSANGSGDTGSGVVIRNDGYILTNNHVVDAATNGGSIRLVFNDGSTASATIRGTDAASDLAVLKTDKKGLKAAQLGSSSGVHVGDPVLAVGSPLGLSGTVTSGIVSALNRPVNTTSSQQQNQNPFDPFGGGGNGSSVATVINAIQTDAAINPGNSGGPLVDLAGRVIGINSAIASVGASGGQSGNIGVGFAIPIDQARVIASQLIDSGKATHAILGVSITDVTDDSGNSQVYLRAVQPGGPAAKAGLKGGDVITAVDGRPVTSADALIAGIRSHQAGDQLSLTYKRNGDTSTVKATLADATSSPS